EPHIGSTDERRGASRLLSSRYARVVVRNNQTGERLNPGEVVMHGFDAGNILGKYLKRGPFAIVRYAAVQLDHTPFHFPIHREMRPPRLIGHLRKNLVANLSVGSAVFRSAAGRAGLRTHESADEIGPADDTDEPPLLNDGEPLDTPFLHQLNDIQK